MRYYGVGAGGVPRGRRHRFFSPAPHKTRPHWKISMNVARRAVINHSFPIYMSRPHWKISMNVAYRDVMKYSSRVYVLGPTGKLV